MTLDDVLHKSCLIGISYLSSDGALLKQAQYAGTVIKVDAENGITVKLDPLKGVEPGPEGSPEFHLPPGLEAWFLAPKGHYKNEEFGIDIINPDFFVTWDVVRKKDDTPEGKQQWWEWHPRTTPPSVN